MDRIATYSPNQIVTSAQLNSIQDQAVGALALATGNLTTIDPGERVIHWESATDIATNTVTLIDGVNVWTDYVVMWALNVKGGANSQIGGADDASWQGTVTMGLGYLGLGAKNSGGTQVSVGNPPAPSNGVSWVVLLAADLWIYVDLFDGFKLKLFNNTGSALRTPYLRLSGTETNKR